MRCAAGGVWGWSSWPLLPLEHGQLEVLAELAAHSGSGVVATRGPESGAGSERPPTPALLLPPPLATATAGGALSGDRGCGGPVLGMLRDADARGRAPVHYAAIALQAWTLRGLWRMLAVAQGSSPARASFELRSELQHPSATHHQHSAPLPPPPPPPPPDDDGGDGGDARLRSTGGGGGCSPLQACCSSCHEHVHYHPEHGLCGQLVTAQVLATLGDYSPADLAAAAATSLQELHRRWDARHGGQPLPRIDQLVEGWAREAWRVSQWLKRAAAIPAGRRRYLCARQRLTWACAGQARLGAAAAARAMSLDLLECVATHSPMESRAVGVSFELAFRVQAEEEDMAAALASTT
jgi:hypothetical protein